MADTLTLVTGGTGFLGLHLVEALRRAGDAVRTCGRGTRPASLPPDVDYHQADLTGPGPLDALTADVDRIVHAAGAASSTSTPAEMEAVNVTGTRRLLQAAFDAGVGRTVYVSTSSVYGKEVALPQPVVEDAECHPGAGYAASKWTAEQVVWEFAAKGLPVSVLRPATIFGPGAVKLVASTILDAAIERFAGLDAFAVPRRPVEMRLVHVDDVVAACGHLITAPDAVGRAFNLDSGVYPSSHEVAEAVAGALGMTCALSDEPAPGLPHDQRQAAHRRMLDAGMRDDILLPKERIRYLNKANRNNRLSLAALAETGFRPAVTDIGAAIAADVDWYAEHRWIL
ncbi:MAG: NAD(P)-dependent oxidoreductase [Egibacteraceae bacterium]